MTNLSYFVLLLVSVLTWKGSSMEDNPCSRIPPWEHPKNLATIWISQKLPANVSGLRAGQFGHVSISETPKFYKKTDANTQHESFMFEFIKTLQKHSSFVFSWPLSRTPQFWQHRCRRGRGLVNIKCLLSPTGIFLEKNGNLDRSVLICWYFTWWKDVPWKTVTISRFHPLNRNQEINVAVPCSRREKLGHANISGRGWWWVDVRERLSRDP